MTVMEEVMVFVDPPSGAYHQDRLFHDGPALNRDNCLSPFIELSKYLAKKGIPVHTADYLIHWQLNAKYNLYYSFGMLTNYKKLVRRKDVILGSFYIMESPVVALHPYREIRKLTQHFNKVYVHNTEGIGLERFFNNSLKLRKFFWPQVKDTIVEELWNNKDREFLVMINSNKKAQFKDHELYSQRIRALIALQRFGTIDLYGHGWNVPFYKIRQTRHFPYLYWKYRKALRAIYKGSVESKYETLSRYKFALCFENSVMPGYITEKIFDCFFVGTVPIYLGAPDVENYIPKNCFIDMRDFDSYGKLYTYLLSLSNDDISSFREAAREYLSSELYQPFTKEKFVKQFEVDLMETLTANRANIRSLQNE